MQNLTKFERMAAVSGLIKAASFMSTAIEAHDLDARDGLSSILLVAGCMAAELAEEVEIAERAAETGWALVIGGTSEAQ